MTWTENHIKKLKESGMIKGYSPINKAGNNIQNNIPVPKKSKYGNKKAVVDDIEFDSAKEAKRYKELKLLLKAGHIGLLEMQVPFELNTGGTHSLVYIADFVYIDVLTGEKVIEDVKGFRTREYKKKKRLIKKVYNIKIKET